MMNSECEQSRDRDNPQSLEAALVVTDCEFNQGLLLPAVIGAGIGGESLIDSRGNSQSLEPTLVVTETEYYHESCNNVQELEPVLVVSVISSYDNWQSLTKAFVVIDSEYNQHSQQATVVRAGVGGDRQ